LIHELTPRYPDDPPAGGDQRPVAGTITLERRDGRVGLSAVELDDHAGGMPHAIALEPPAARPHTCVHGRSWQSVGSEEGKEPILEIAPGNPRTEPPGGEDRPQRRGPSAARVAVEEVLDRQRVGHPERLGPLYDALERVPVEADSEIEERPRNRRHRDPVSSSDLVGQNQRLVYPEAGA